MSNLSLYQMTAEYNEAFESMIDSDIPVEAIRDTLEGLQGEITVKGANVAAFILNLEAEADKVKTVEDRIRDRRKALEAKADRMRDYLKQNMERCGITNIKALDGSFSATLTKPRASVVIDNPAQIPSHFMKVKYEPDKTAIKEALDDGQQIDGAHIEHKPSLRIT
jgi:hypothetical protein